jgi:hypothetical protein
VRAGWLAKSKGVSAMQTSIVAAIAGRGMNAAVLFMLPS